MKSDLELIEECLEKTKKELITLQTQQAAHNQVVGGSFSSIESVGTITTNMQMESLQRKVSELEARRASLLRDNLEENLIVGSIEDIKDYLSNLQESKGLYRLVRVKDDEKE